MRESLIRRAGPHIGVAVALLLLSLIFLWPIPLHLDDHIIGGGGDALLECWTLCWDTHFLRGGASSLFDANICHPEKTSLAFADHLFAQSLLFLPLYMLTGNQALSFNVLVILTFVLNGWGIWLCGRNLGFSRPASLLAAILFAYFPNRLYEVPHLHILSSQWLPFSFYFLLRFLRRRPGGWIDLPAFTFFSLLCVLSSFYQALIWAVLVSVTIVVTLGARQVGGKQLGQLAAAGLAITMITIPFALPYFTVSDRYQVTRSIEENIHNSARPGDFLTAPADNLIYGNPSAKPHSSDSPPRRFHPLFPGLLFTLLLVCGITALFIPGRSPGDQRPLSRERLILLLSALTALILSFGPALPWGSGEARVLIPLPYSLLYHWIPGLKGLRVPARMVLLFHFSGALLAAYGLQRLLSPFKASRAWAVTLVVCALAFAEGLSLDVIKCNVFTDQTLTEAYQDVQRLPEDTVLLELPTQREFFPMYNSTFHFHKLANGRSGIIPPVTHQLSYLTAPENPYAFGPALIDHALQTGINTILFHRRFNTKRLNRLSLSALNRQDCLDPLGRYKNRDLLFRINAEKGREADITPLPGGSTEPVAEQALQLKSRDAFPSSFHRPMMMSAEDEQLHIGERIHFRWLKRIPRGRWQLRLWVAEVGQVTSEELSVTLTVEIAGVEVLTNKELQAGQPVRGIPVEVARTAHYRINCMVRQHPNHRPFDLVLETVRLVPVSTIDAKP